ncbi:MAG: NAD(+) diphosphatase [Dehalococcoidia bacterium]|nr:NAD(+) diphosphatase [Dehalococcoidia bacterium]
MDRGYRERRDERWLTDMARDENSRFLPLKDLNILMFQDPQIGLGWLGVDELRRLRIDSVPLFLGQMGNRMSQASFFAVDISDHKKAAQALTDTGSYQFMDARTVTKYVSGEDSGIVAQARSQVNWHNRNGFCSICGHKTFIKRGGQVRQCSYCDTEHYPHTDPVAITLVSDNERCLLGQSHGRLARTNMYSALAGFVDQGESIEEAAAREIMEEAGICIKNIRYHSSQPWPFPHSLMIGCHADAVTTDISIDDEEMADVRWFERGEVLLALESKSGTLSVPGPIAIAHHIIKAWAMNDTR